MSWSGYVHKAVLPLLGSLVWYTGGCVWTTDCYVSTAAALLKELHVNMMVGEVA